MSQTEAPVATVQAKDAERTRIKAFFAKEVTEARLLRIGTIIVRSWLDRVTTRKVALWVQGASTFSGAMRTGALCLLLVRGCIVYG